LTSQSPFRSDVFFSDDGRRFSQVLDDGPLPDISARFELLADPAISGIGLVTSQEDVSINLRETATHSIGELISDLIATESVAWRTARVTDMTVRVPSFATEARIDFHRNIVNLERSVPLQTFIDLIARYVAALPDDELESMRAAATDRG
jgi:hypothetical protein